MAGLQKCNHPEHPLHDPNACLDGQMTTVDFVDGEKRCATCDWVIPAYLERTPHICLGCFFPFKRSAVNSNLSPHAKENGCTGSSSSSTG